MPLSNPHPSCTVTGPRGACSAYCYSTPYVLPPLVHVGDVVIFYGDVEERPSPAVVTHVVGTESYPRVNLKVLADGQAPYDATADHWHNACWPPRNCYRERE